MITLEFDIIFNRLGKMSYSVTFKNSEDYEAWVENLKAHFKIGSKYVCDLMFLDFERISAIILYGKKVKGER